MEEAKRFPCEPPSTSTALAGPSTESVTWGHVWGRQGRVNAQFLQLALASADQHITMVLWLIGLGLYDEKDITLR